MAGSGLVRIMGGGDHSLFMAEGVLVRMKGGDYSFIIYGRGLAGKNEGGGTIDYLWQGVGW